MNPTSGFTAFWLTAGSAKWPKSAERRLSQVRWDCPSACSSRLARPFQGVRLRVSVEGCSFG